MARVAIATGGAGGLGNAIAERLRLDGLEVVAADLPAPDVADPDSVDRFVAEVLAERGSLDVLKPETRGPRNNEQPAGAGQLAPTALEWCIGLVCAGRA